MKKLFFILTIISFIGCDADKWDKRYEEQQRHQCDCVSEWQQSIPKKVQALYKVADSLASISREPLLKNKSK